MIKYGLVCDAGHEFEGWFQNGAAFDRQAAAGQVACPRCGSVAVSKAIMAPSVVGHADRPPSGLAPTRAPEAEFLAALRSRLLSKSEYVGPRFAEEARRMHYDEQDQRSIHGEATDEEAKGLLDEGIAFFALPTLPKDHN